MSNVIDKIRLSGTDYTLSATTSGVSVVEVTQAQYDALPSSAKTDTSKIYVITDAEAGDLTNYYTKTETNSAITQATSGKVDTTTFNTYSGSVETALSGKQDTLVSGTNIKTINNESILGSGNIDIQGGGKAIEAGRGISITTGETVDTVSFNLPISAGTGNNSIKCGGNCIATKIYSAAFGNNSQANGPNSFAINQSRASGQDSFSQGTSYAEQNFSAAFGRVNHSKNDSELSCGKYNNSVSASTTFGNSGNTLFSVGNGINENSRHNAFEIRQNGDIYYFDGTNDVKLQDKFSSIDTTIGDINTILQSI